MNTLRIKTKIDNSELPAQLNLLKQKLKDVEKNIDNTKRILALTGKQAEGLNMERFKKDLVKSEAEAEKLRNQISKIESANNGVATSTTEAFGKGIQSLKKFGFALFSIRGIYSMVSKASSAYLSQDTELAQKLQSVWVGLGSFLVPVIEAISNALLKGLGYLNVFIKALTGVDFIANANAKALNKQAKATSGLSKATKELNNQLYSFDEMNVRQSQSNIASGGGISTGGLNDLIQIPELDTSIVEKLQNMAHWLKENWDWLSKVAIALGATFGVAKMTGLLNNISKLIGGTGFGLIGLQALLVAIAGAFTIYLYVKGYEKVKEALEDYNRLLELNKKGEEGLTDQTQKVSDSFWELYDSGKATNDVMRTQEQHLANSTEALLNQYENLQKDIHWWGEFTGSNDKVRASLNEVKNQLEINTNDYRKLYEAGKLSKEGVEQYKLALQRQIEVLVQTGDKTENLRKEYERISGKSYTATVRINAQDNTSSVLNNIRNSILNLGTTIANIGMSAIRFKTGGIKKCATGSIVNNPGRGVAIGGNVIAGESGREGVIPLTDPNAMTELGETIGRYITVNLTNITKLDSRTINRQTNKVNTEDDFIGNW